MMEQVAWLGTVGEAVECVCLARAPEGDVECLYVWLRPLGEDVECLYVWLGPLGEEVDCLCDRIEALVNSSRYMCD